VWRAGTPRGGAAQCRALHRAGSSSRWRSTNSCARRQARGPGLARHRAVAGGAPARRSPAARHGGRSTLPVASTRRSRRVLRRRTLVGIGPLPGPFVVSALPGERGRRLGEALEAGRSARWPDSSRSRWDQTKATQRRSFDLLATVAGGGRASRGSAHSGADPVDIGRSPASPIWSWTAIPGPHRPGAEPADRERHSLHGLCGDGRERPRSEGARTWAHRARRTVRRDGAGQTAGRHPARRPCRGAFEALLHDAPSPRAGGGGWGLTVVPPDRQRRPSAAAIEIVSPAGRGHDPSRFHAAAPRRHQPLRP